MVPTKKDEKAKPRKWKSLPSSDRFKKSIKVKVGSEEDEQEYTMHKSLICAHSDFFRAACMGSFKESVGGVVCLPDGNPAAFERFLVWLYDGRIPSISISWSDDDAWSHMICLYILGDQLQVRSFQNAVLGTLGPSVIHRTASIGHVNKAFEKTPPRSPLRKIIIEKIAHAPHIASSCIAQRGNPELVAGVIGRLMFIRDYPGLRSTPAEMEAELRDGHYDIRE
ncbi:MAG: hypothetical protein M1833_007398 [Piccolia ochrophora]|nr:MAG: hypothetical protein M1833_007398 [Piccolia ochrophora]